MDRHSRLRRDKMTYDMVQEGFSQKDVAEQLGISQPEVSRRLKNYRAAVRDKQKRTSSTAGSFSIQMARLADDKLQKMWECEAPRKANYKHDDRVACAKQTIAMVEQMKAIMADWMYEADVTKNSRVDPDYLLYKWLKQRYEPDAE